MHSLHGPVEGFGFSPHLLKGSNEHQLMLEQQLLEQQQRSLKCEASVWYGGGQDYADSPTPPPAYNNSSSLKVSLPPEDVPTIDLPDHGQDYGAIPQLEASPRRFRNNVPHADVSGPTLGVPTFANPDPAKDQPPKVPERSSEVSPPPLPPKKPQRLPQRDDIYDFPPDPTISGNLNADDTEQCIHDILESNSQRPSQPPTSKEEVVTVEELSKMSILELNEKMGQLPPHLKGMSIIELVDYISKSKEPNNIIKPSFSDNFVAAEAAVETETHLTLPGDYKQESVSSMSPGPPTACTDKKFNFEDEEPAVKEEPKVDDEDEDRYAIFRDLQLDNMAGWSSAADGPVSNGEEEPIENGHAEEEEAQEEEEEGEEEEEEEEVASIADEEELEEPEEDEPVEPEVVPEEGTDNDDFEVAFGPVSGGPQTQWTTFDDIDKQNYMSSEHAHHLRQKGYSTIGPRGNRALDQRKSSRDSITSAKRSSISSNSERGTPNPFSDNFVKVEVENGPNSAEVFDLSSCPFKVHAKVIDKPAEVAQKDDDQMIWGASSGIPKSDSVNIFTIKDDPFDDEFFN